MHNVEGQNNEPEKVPSFKDMQEQYHAVMAFFYKDFATKEDLRETRLELKQEIAETKRELKQDIAKVEQEIDETKKELKKDIAAAEGRLRQEIATVKQDIRWFITGGFIVMTGIIGLFTYLK
jgi:gas vesicle protein